MKLGVLLASHGPMAEATIKSSQMLMGEQENLMSCCLAADEALEDYRARINKSLDTLYERCDHVLALCDIQGGTPCNVLTRCLLERPQLMLVSGFNLPFLLELCMSREFFTQPHEIIDLLDQLRSQSLLEVPVPEITDSSANTTDIDAEDLDL